MELKVARIKYHSQKRGAALRGIRWELTFKQWLEWWGDDLDNRGCRPHNLQMQRHGDIGPYALGNIRKGVPKENGRTRSAVYQNRKVAEAHAAHQAQLDAEEPGEGDSIDQEEMTISEYFSQDRREDFVRRNGKWDAAHR